MMLRRLKRGLGMLAMALALAFLAGAAAGCTTVNDPVIGHVGSMDIRYSTYIQYYNNYYNFYNNYGLYDVSTAEKHENFANQVWDAIVKNYLPVYYARQAGVTLTEEEEAQVQADLQTEENSYIEGYANRVDASITDEAERLKAAKELLLQDMKDNNTTYEKYFGRVETQIRDAAVGNKFVESLMSDISVSEDEITEYYNSKLEEQRKYYADNPGSYYTDYTYFVDYGGLQPLVAPEGYGRYKQIFIQDAEDKDVDAIVKKIEDGLAEGTSFDSLMNLYGEDAGMIVEPYMTEGYILSEYNESEYYTEFYEAAIALENIGDISAPIKSEYGTHIIQKCGVVSTDPIPLEKVHDTIKTIVDTEKKNARLDEFLEKWKAETDITFNYSRVRYVGRDQ